MKYRLFKLVLFLLLGAIVNVAVAWGCALWIDPFNGRHEHARIMLDGIEWIQQVDTAGVALSGQWRAAAIVDGNQRWWVDCYRRPGAHRLVRGPIVLPGQFSKTRNLGTLPAWADFDLRAHDLGRSRGFEIIDGRGWPVVCLRSRFKIADGYSYIFEPWSYTDSPGVRKSGFLLADKKGTSLPAGWVLAEARRSIPLDPVLGGFVFNTVFYAVVLAMIIYGPSTVRKLTWIGRGWCSRCGYDLRGTSAGGGGGVCPRSVGRDRQITGDGIAGFTL